MKIINKNEAYAVMQGQLSARLIPGPNRKRHRTWSMLFQELRNFLIRGDRYSFGIIGRRCVTTAGVNYLRDYLCGSGSNINLFKYHDCGIGTNIEAVGDQALQTPWGGSRVVGSQDAQTAKTYKTVATITFNATKNITEHGLFSASTSGVLWDRTKFSSIGVVDGDGIEFTYSLLINDGG